MTTPTFWQARKGYLNYHGKYHSVECMPSSLFKAIILDAYPDFAMTRAYHQASYDIVDKWSILQHYRMKLFYLRNGEYS